MRLDLSTRTLFSEFQEIVFSRAALQRKIKRSSTFVKKKVKGKIYWYQQQYKEDQYKQTYFGPSNKKNDTEVKEKKKRFLQDKKLIKNLLEQEKRQAAMLHRGGLPSLDRRMAIILTKLSEALLIDQCGLLIGTFAFTAYSGILGSLFDKMTLRTQDIDIICDDTIGMTIEGVIKASDFFSQPSLQCREVPSFSPKKLPSSFITKDGIRIDLLVPLHGKEKKVTVMPSLLGAGATPLRFLDFLIQEPVRTVLLSPQGGIPILIPSPARYAIHKLIVASYRPISESTKKKKDLHQASQLIQILHEEHPIHLKEAHQEARKRGKKWEKAISQSLKLLPEEAQSLL